MPVSLLVRCAQNPDFLRPFPAIDLGTIDTILERISTAGKLLIAELLLHVGSDRLEFRRTIDGIDCRPESIDLILPPAISPFGPTGDLMGGAVAVAVIE